MTWESHILARPDPDRQLDVEANPARANWSLAENVSSDGHALQVRFSCSLRARPEKAERTLLAEALLHGQEPITALHAVRWLQPALESSVQAVLPTKPAPFWLSPGGRSELKDLLHRAANDKAFSCGLEVLAPFELDIDSPSIHRQQRLAGQMQHLSQLATLLQQFEATKNATPGVSAAQVLGQFSPQDQATLLPNLLRAAAERQAPAPLFAITGTALIKIAFANTPEITGTALTKIDPANDSPQTQHFSLPADLGPLRSITASTHDGRSILLIGARSGVMIVDMHEPARTRLFAAPGVQSALGFSRVTICDYRIVASHSEAGLFTWNIAGSEPPRRLIETGVRWLSRIGQSALAFVSGNQLLIRHRDEHTTTVAGVPVDEVADLLPCDDALLLIRRNGTIWRIEESAQVTRLEWSAPSGVTAAALLPWLDGNRLLTATDNGAILSRGLNDSVIQHYQAPYRGLRMLRAAAHYLVAVPEDRQRIVLWRPWDGSRVAQEIHVTALSGHRVADIEFARIDDTIA